MAVRKVVALAPQPKPAKRLKSATRGVSFCEVLAIRERPVQRYSEVFALEAKWQGCVVVVDIQLTLSFLVVEMEDCRHRFCSAEV